MKRTQTALAALILAALIPAPRLRAAPPTPYIQSANNAASYDSTAIAQGSMFVIFGGFLGPTTLVSATTLPLPITLADTSVTVKSGASTLSCPMFYTSSGQVVAVLPSNTPLGPATVSVTYFNLSSGANSATIDVVASSVGVFTPNASGIGMGIFTDALSGTHITASTPATPGQLLTGWVTGVGADGSDNGVAPVLNNPGVQVWVGGQSAQMTYAGPGGGVALDQLNFFVPAAATLGCNVPVVVTSNGRASNATTIPIGATAGVPCSDSSPTFPAGVLTSASAGNPLRLGFIVVAPTSGATQASRHSEDLGSQLSAALHVKVPPADAERILRAVQSHNARALKSALSKYAAQWRALSPTTKALLARAVGAGPQTEALVVFGKVTNESAAAGATAAMLPPAGTCILSPSPLPGVLGATALGLDAGGSVSVVGAAGSFTLQESNVGTYKSGKVFDPNFGGLPAGQYTVSGSGGRDIGAFSSSINFSSPPHLTNPASQATINRSQPLTVTWTGGVSGHSALIVGSSNHNNTGAPPQVLTFNRGFVCATDAGTGSFTVPSYILSAMWPASGAVVITADPRSEEISIPGLDAVWFVDFSAGSASVTFE